MEKFLDLKQVSLKGLDVTDNGYYPKTGGTLSGDLNSNGFFHSSGLIQANNFDLSNETYLVNKTGQVSFLNEDGLSLVRVDRLDIKTSGNGSQINGFNNFEIMVGENSLQITDSKIVTDNLSINNRVNYSSFSITGSGAVLIDVLDTKYNAGGIYDMIIIEGGGLSNLKADVTWNPSKNDLSIILNNQEKNNKEFQLTGVFLVSNELNLILSQLENSTVYVKKTLINKPTSYFCVMQNKYFDLQMPSLPNSWSVIFDLSIYDTQSKKNILASINEDEDGNLTLFSEGASLKIKEKFENSWTFEDLTLEDDKNYIIGLSYDHTIEKIKVGVLYDEEFLIKTGISSFTSMSGILNNFDFGLSNIPDEIFEGSVKNLIYLDVDNLSSQIFNEVKSGIFTNSDIIELYRVNESNGATLTGISTNLTIQNQTGAWNEYL
jgi:hypothetical protein